MNGTAGGRHSFGERGEGRSEWNSLSRPQNRQIMVTWRGGGVGEGVTDLNSFLSAVAIPQLQLNKTFPLPTAANARFLRGLRNYADGNDRASKSPNFAGDILIFYITMKISRSPDLE